MFIIKVPIQRSLSSAPAAVTCPNLTPAVCVCLFAVFDISSVSRQSHSDPGHFPPQPFSSLYYFLNSHPWSVFSFFYISSVPFIPRVIVLLVSPIFVTFISKIPAFSREMTVNYHKDIQLSRPWTFINLLWCWKGSIWKAVYLEVIIYVILYASVSFIYRLGLSDGGQR